ncbi:ABC transporter substrate-binding protein [Actinocatenispora rupis]|uniref:ABC transporter ATP-binding protein n=1 Tax=Actinocatenispora rupis TaxID=519421 RepID=A0A8J3NAI8_9ACTN|nr:extracellular solute-binding protein [Actinocatenispora rupis]GID09607.1 ABC transporter ATP-binding protein [Actinocatenispora rupis]
MTGPGIGRRAFGAMGLGLGAAALAGCGTGRGDGRQRATFYGAPDVNAALVAAFGLLRREHPELAVDSEFGAFQGYYDKLATRFAGGAAPDVVMMDFTHLAGYAQRGALLDVTRYAPDPVDGAAGRPAVLDGGRFRDRLYGVPIGTHTQAIVVRTDLAAKYGVAVPDATTWESYARICTDIGKASGGTVFGTEDGGGSDFALDIWVRQRGGQLFTESGRLGATREHLAEWFEYWRRLRASGGAASIDVTANTTVRALVAGQAVIGFNFSNATGIQGQVKAPLRMLTIPGVSARDRPGAYQYIKPTNMFSVNRSTARPDRAARILGAFLTDERVAGRLGMTLGSPPARAVFDAARAKATGVGRTILDFDAMVQRNATATRYPPTRPLGADQLLTATGALLGRLNLSVGYGQVSPRQAAEDFVNQATSYLQA